MSNPFSTPNSLDPEAGFTQTPSVAQAANDLRAAAGEKARELVHTAEEKAAALKDRAVETAQHFRETATERATQFKAAATEKATAFKSAAADKAHHLNHTYIMLTDTSMTMSFASLMEAVNIMHDAGWEINNMTSYGSYMFVMMKNLNYKKKNEEQ